MDRVERRSPPTSSLLQRSAVALHATQLMVVDADTARRTGGSYGSTNRFTLPAMGWAELQSLIEHSTAQHVETTVVFEDRESTLLMLSDLSVKALSNLDVETIRRRLGEDGGYDEWCSLLRTVAVYATMSRERKQSLVVRCRRRARGRISLLPQTWS